MDQRIRNLQAYLLAAGFSPGPIDGVWGRRSEAALVACQVARGGTRRVIRKIVVHCTATREGQPISTAEIRRWHVAQGWRDIGYHYVVLLDGTVQSGRPVDQVGSHVAGHNSDSVGITYVGGVATNGQTPKDTRTSAQKASLERELRALAHRYPAAVIVGHRDLSPDKNDDGVIQQNEWMKACPSFDAPAAYGHLEANR